VQAQAQAQAKGLVGRVGCESTKVILVGKYLCDCSLSGLAVWVLSRVGEGEYDF
jgi:hypothetical protein